MFLGGETFKNIIMALIKIMFFLILPFWLFASPKGGEVKSGSIQISAQDNNVIISQSSDKAIIHWKDFSIKNGETTQFILPSQNSSTLNRVIGGNLSEIYGDLKSNGILYLVNPNGIVVGPTGTIDTASFIASTFDLQDKEYLEGKKIGFTDRLSSNILNRGIVKTTHGDIIFVAKDIENEGSLLAEKGKVSLNAGYELYLLPSEQMKIVIRLKKDGTIKNSGLIKATQTELRASNDNVYGLAIKTSGTIDAQGITEKDGKILLSAEDGIIDVSGTLLAKSKDSNQTQNKHLPDQKKNIGGKVHIFGKTIKLEKDAFIDVSEKDGGGEVLVGGDYQGKNPDISNSDYVYMDKDAVIHADAIDNGNGGKVILWSEKGTNWQGFISAQAGKEKGDGGFVEVSSKGFLYPKFNINVSAVNGKAGTLLLDPSDIEITDAASVPAWANPYNPGPGEANPCNAQAADIENALNGGANVTIATSNGDQGSGDITVKVHVLWTTAKTLTLTADRSVIIDATGSLESTNSGANFDAIAITTLDNGGAANYDGVTNNGTITAISGNIDITGIGGSGGGGAYNYGVYNLAEISTTGSDANAGDITIIGTGGDGASGNCGVYNSGSSANIATDSGLIDITGIGGDGSSNQNFGIRNDLSAEIYSSGSGTVTLDGTGGAGISGNRGVNNESSAKIYSTTGALSITGTSNGTSSNNHGIRNKNQAQIYSTGSTVTLHGTGSASGTDQNYGVANDGDTYATTKIYSTGGTLSITGIGGGTGDNNHGINNFDSGVITDEGAVAITMTGTAGNGSSSVGIKTVAGTDIGETGGSATTGAVTLTADTTDYAGNIYTTGDLTLQPNTASLAIPIGTGSDYITLANLLAYTAGHANTYIGKSGGAHTITLGGGGSDVVVNSNDTTFRGKLITVITDDLTCANAAKMTLLASQKITVDVTSTIININAGANFDAITLTASGGVVGSNYDGVINNGSIVTFSGNINITGTGGNSGASNYGVWNEGDIATLGSDANAGDITIIGTGGDGSGDRNYGVFNNGAGSQITTDAGAITIMGIGGAGTEHNYGACNADNAEIETTTGSIDITGTGGAGSGAYNYGVYNTSAGIIYATSTGSVTLDGTGGAGTTNNYGVLNTANGSKIYSVDGALNITGLGGAGSGDKNYGIMNNSRGQIYSSGSGTVTLDGTGGDGTDSNYGVFQDGNALSTTQIYSTNGALSITGEGDGSGTLNFGIYNYRQGQIYSSGSTITLTGTGGGGTGSNYGVYQDGSGSANTKIYTTGDTLSITGTGGNGGSNNYGVYNYNSSLITSDTQTITIIGTGGTGVERNYGVYNTSAAEIKTTTGAIDITGTGGAGSGAYNYGIYNVAGGMIYGVDVQPAASTGSVTLDGTGGAGTTDNCGILNSAT
ncbi:MAG: Heme/hemopexin-binding protein, partial [Candidatus Anoxychlamydiales bacterium]|nr:Heme/hemopexin-binding protein [Candidatus Anoxychlamydiales bacterium]